ncbi:MAG: YeeE/YedE family protein [Burkholderiaceae bacterium]
MPSTDLSSLNALTTQVLGLAFFLSVCFGAIAQRTHFCTMGALSDVVLMGDWTRMRQWALAAGVAMLGFAWLAGTGQLDPTKTLYASTRWTWLSAALGGFLFGIGMVFASGCGNKTLVRLGGGNLKSLVVFLVMALSAFATLRGLTAVLRLNTVDRVATEWPAGTRIPELLSTALGFQAQSLTLIAGLLLGTCLVIWAIKPSNFRRFDNLLAGVGLGAIVTAMWWTSASLGYVAEHPGTLQEAFVATNSGRSEALSFTAPLAYSLDWVLFFSDTSRVLTVGIVAVAGVVAGSCICAVASGTFRWEGFAGVEDLGFHLTGALLMGVGGVTALGCTVGQGLSGLSTLSLTSFTAVGAIVAGGFAALKYQSARVGV